LEKGDQTGRGKRKIRVFLPVGGRRVSGKAINKGRPILQFGELEAMSDCVWKKTVRLLGEGEEGLGAGRRESSLKNTNGGKGACRSYQETEIFFAWRPGRKEGVKIGLAERKTSQKSIGVGGRKKGALRKQDPNQGVAHRKKAFGRASNKRNTRITKRSRWP